MVDMESSETARLLHQFSRAGLRTAHQNPLNEKVADFLVPFIPDVVVLDPSTLAEKGRPHDWAVRQLLSRFPNAKIAVATTHYSLVDCFRCAQAGAAAYLAKPTSATEVLTFLSNQPISRRTTCGSQTAQSLARFEWEHICRVVADCQGNKTKAAKVLNIPRFTLQKKLQKYPPSR